MSAEQQQLDDPEPFSFSLDLVMNDDRWRWLAELEPKARALMDRTFCRVAPILQAEVEATIVFTADREVQILNRDYRQKDAPTNVLSFATAEGEDLKAQFYRSAAGGPPVILGDIFIAYETCDREAAAQGKSMIDHVGHLMVHGLLHLLGYDHINDEDAEVMEALERELLQEIGIKDPYAGDR